jgi:hypothetical protein
MLGIVDQDRVAEAELLDAPCNLPNLFLRMGAGIVWVYSSRTGCIQSAFRRSPVFRSARMKAPATCGIAT